MTCNKKIVIIDYGVGNLYSIQRAFSYFNFNVLVSGSSKDVADSDGIVMPGVGSFGAGMRGLKDRGLVGAVKEYASKRKPILGICLGAQLMLSAGYEFGEFKGLDLIKGRVIKFPKLKNNEKVPHVGWNKIIKSKIDWNSTILDSIKEGSEMYFVHSYILDPFNRKNILSISNYGGLEFCSAINDGNIYGCQFHPEKSGKIGLQIIKNFIGAVIA